MKLSKEKYLKLKVAADENGGVGSHEIHNAAGKPVCLWGLALFAKITDMSPYPSAFTQGDVDNGIPEWLLQASVQYNREEAILPNFGQADDAVDYLRVTKTSRTRVPLDEVLAILKVEIEDDSEGLEAVGTSTD